MTEPWLTPRRLKSWHGIWKRSHGKAWEPPGSAVVGSAAHASIEGAIKAGLVRRVDGRCGFELIRDAMVAWTEVGAMLMEKLDEIENLARPPSADAGVRGGGGDAPGSEAAA